MSQTARRILVVDDEQRVRQAIERVLGESGYEIITASDGRQGLEMVAAHAPDLVLVDLMMPVMDGMEFLDQARRRYPGLSSVVITGFATLDKAVEAMKQGADDFLAKPFKPRELKLVVERALKRAATLQDISIEKSRTRALINAMSNGVLVVNPDGEAVLANPALLNLLERKEEGVIGQPYQEVVPWAEVKMCLAATLRGEERKPEQARCVCRQGDDEDALHFQVSCAPFHDARNAVVGAVAVFDDVTAWHRLDQYKSQFVTTVAHDIVSPLAAVQGQLQNLGKGLLGPLEEAQTVLVERARTRLQGVADLCRDLLDLSKIEAGAMGQQSRLDLAPLVQEALKVLGGPAEAKGQSLAVELASGLPPVLGVAEEFLDVVLNLVGNAIKYTQDGGEISLRLWAEGSELLLEVADNGPGIPPEEQDAVFKRFHRVRTPENRHITGTGLGLAIVKRVVDNLHGKLSLRSQPGQGCRFLVSLPAA
ncbi:MAG: response regulator [Desulfarculaceae bacterium]|nr:response regulator [Desulfarculaceae bacterium]MCF8071475.1 response regulator [Desulfarculaceae bacterium]MCF8103397.1 response regulator [Desulfarculaceae bacterium]MCF8118057.1 response regulator [Desulfarculaceae bacterium]